MSDWMQEARRTAYQTQRKFLEQGKITQAQFDQYVQRNGLESMDRSVRSLQSRFNAPGVISSPSPFQTGLKTSIEDRKSFFQRTPDLTEGMGIVDRAKFAAGRALGDIGSETSRSQYWRWNHPSAIMSEGFKRLSGGSKVGGSLAAFGGTQAYGQTSGAFDLTNPGQAFRPAGFAAAYPKNPKSPAEPENAFKELAGRYLFNKGGGLLPWEQFQKERPDVSRDRYEHFQSYLKSRNGQNMPEGAFDLGNMGVIKGTSQGINGPEIRFQNFPVTPASVASGIGATFSVSGLARSLKGAKSGNALIAAGGSLISGGEELRKSQIAGDSVPRQVVRSVAAPAVSAVRFAAEPIHKVVQDFGTYASALTSGQLFNKEGAREYQRTIEANQKSRSQFFDDAPKNIAGGLSSALNAVKGFFGQNPPSQPKPTPIPPGKLPMGPFQTPGTNDIIASQFNRDGTVNPGEIYRSDQEGARQSAAYQAAGNHLPPEQRKALEKQRKAKEKQMGSESRFKQAELQHGKGGSIDRTNSSRERQREIDAAAKMYASDNTLEGVKVRTDGQVKVAKINTAGKVRVAEIGFDGKLLQHGKGGSVDRSNQSKEKIADMRFGLGGSEDRKSQMNYRAKTDTESIRQTGQARVATIKGEFGNQREAIKGQFSVDRESVKQDGTVRVAKIKSEAQQYSADSQALGTAIAALSKRKNNDWDNWMKVASSGL